jgi:hypothetical protein
MLSRAALGLLKGCLLGILLSSALVFGLGVVVWPGWLSYLAMALTGIVAGLTLGKPIWARGALVEASLKAVVGAVVGLVATFGAHKWISGVSVDLASLGAGKGALGDLPAALLPLLSAGLGLLYEADNSGSDSAGLPRRVEEPRVRLDDEPSADEVDRTDTESSGSRAGRTR